MKLTLRDNKKYFLLWIWSFVLIADSQEPVITLPQGRLAGIKIFTQASLTPIEIFYGIPYAVAPIGRYRFSAPERHPGWQRMFFAHRIPPRCPQETTADEPFVSEDCLYLNVWTPRVQLIVRETWSHGPVQTLPCEELAAEGVVTVTVSYRLHFFGFLMLKSITARGNLAILDQYLALLWVRENIAAFGGDPGSITLMGHSAGADSILYHMASPRSVGLFQRAILMSPRDIWTALDKDRGAMSQIEAESASRQLAQDLGCDSQSVEDILRCLRSRSYKDFVKKNNMTYQLQPVPDDFLPEPEQFQPRSVAASLASSRPLQLDLLLGTASLEAINHRNSGQYEELSRQSKSVIMDYVNDRLIPELINMLSIEYADLVTLKEAVLWEFWGPRGGTSAQLAWRAAYAQSSAQWGAASALLAARLVERGPRVYVYRYDQPGGIDLTGTQLNYTGAAHGAELAALFGDSVTLQAARRRATPQEQRASIHFRRYIASFIKYGYPSSDSEWPRYRVGQAYIHSIRDAEGGEEGARSPTRDVAFWLQYLPQLSNMISSSGLAEKLPLEQGESRLRGGVFALSGVLVVLLLLLLACALLLRWERARRNPDFDVHTQ